MTGGSMDIPWDDVQLFLAVAESGGLSAAARKLRIGQPTVSRRLAELERRLGYQLFLREAAGARLTSSGERLVEPARKMAEWAGEVTRTAAKGERAPEGVVRVTAPPGVAFDFLAPMAGWLRDKLPLIRLEVLSSINYLDLARGEADLALRGRPSEHADLVTVASLEHDNAVFVAPEYARRLPAAPKMTELDWIAWAPPFEHLPPNPQLAAAIPGFRPTFTADNFLVLLRAAQSGLGAIVLDRVAHRFAGAHGLVPLPVDLGPHAKGRTYLVCARSALDIPRVRAVAHALTDELARAEAAARARVVAEGAMRTTGTDAARAQPSPRPRAQPSTGPGKGAARSPTRPKPRAGRRAR
jgi:DNA-binding transcriptional LysR family regulator